MKKNTTQPPRPLPFITLLSWGVVSLLSTVFSLPGYLYKACLYERRPKYNNYEPKPIERRTLEHRSLAQRGLVRYSYGGDEGDSDSCAWTHLLRPLPLVFLGIVWIHSRNPVFFAIPMMAIHLSKDQVERLLSYLDEVDEVLRNLRALFVEGCHDEKGSEVPEASVPNIDVSKIQFYIKGGKPAHKTAKFAYAFSRDRDGGYYPDSRELVQYLERYGGPIQVGNWEYLLSKDGKFLNRRAPK